MSVRIVDNRRKVRQLLDQKIKKGLTAVGLIMVETVLNYMEKKYGSRIFDTGTLLRSITFEVDESQKKITIGTNIDYAIFVHNGTRRMRARPFLFDAITENIQVWKEVLAEQLGQGWDINISS